MISLTHDELQAMNGVIDNKLLFGVTFTNSNENSEERVEIAQKGLAEKGYILDGKLTDKFLIVARLLDEYKKSERYLFINNLRISLEKGPYAKVIELTDKEITISRVPKITVVKKYVEVSEFFKKYQKAQFFPFEEQTITMEAYEEDLDSGEWDNLMVIQKYEKEQLQDMRTYYFNDVQAYCYNFITNKKQERGAKDFRNELLLLLEVEV
ncbi:DUF5081 family protein [Listeria booriae]|uniref:DUF5081 family protein n=1 Tax=Listeria booriae TaxID=1552123 RepID=UPI0016288B58|nr:DUF5081 family protein [Listeria booriae]MBC2259810.1 DUF5081 family protein [Listeria booriae]